MIVQYSQCKILRHSKLFLSVHKHVLKRSCSNSFRYWATSQCRHCGFIDIRMYTRFKLWVGEGGVRETHICDFPMSVAALPPHCIFWSAGRKIGFKLWVLLPAWWVILNHLTILRFCFYSSMFSSGFWKQNVYSCNNFLNAEDSGLRTF